MVAGKWQGKSSGRWKEGWDCLMLMGEVQDCGEGKFGLSSARNRICDVEFECEAEMTLVGFGEERA